MGSSKSGEKGERNGESVRKGRVDRKKREKRRKKEFKKRRKNWRKQFRPTCVIILLPCKPTHQQPLKSNQPINPTNSFNAHDLGSHTNIPVQNPSGLAQQHKSSPVLARAISSARTRVRQQRFRFFLNLFVGALL